MTRLAFHHSATPRWLAIAAAGLFVLCTTVGAGSAAADWVTILHTNDIHGNYAERPASWLDDRPLVGGFRALSGYVESVRYETDPLLVDAGDVMSGDPITVLEYDGVMGGGIMQLMNAMRYDVMALGNHEFDNGRDELDAWLAEAQFPVLSANLWVDETGERLLPATHVFERRGVRIGVIGVILDDLAGVVATEPLRGLRVESTLVAARREAERLDPETDLLIVLAHAGLDDCRAIAGAVQGVVDVVIAGHDHRRTKQPIDVDGVLIIEAGSALTNVGRLDLDVRDDAIASYRYELVLLDADLAGLASPEVNAVHERCHAAIQAEYGVTLAELASDWKREYRQESNVGNWVCDAMKNVANADFAVTNSSGLRADIEAGPLSRLDIHRLSPFSNLLSRFECTGADLLTFAAHNVRRAVVEKQSVVQVAGLTYAYDEDGVIHDLRVGGAPVDPARVYVGATNDFVLFSQPDKYLGFTPERRERLTPVISEVLASEAQRQERIDARVEGRMRELEVAAAPGEPAASSE